ncbi:MAG: alpha/beta fold hydrolase [Desulfovibrio sp.]|nr:alpha/beta fold hydrolase [Desulfovibrio sp.]
MADEQKALERERPVEIDGSMGKLYGLLALPDLAPDGVCPVTVFSHGFKGNLYYHLWAPIIELLNAAGVGTLRFDFNGSGKSQGEFVDMTVPNEIDDLINVVAWVKAQPFAGSVSLVGHSQGGVVSGMAAGKCGASQIKSLVLLSAAAVLRDDALRGDTQGTRYDPWHLDQPYYPLANGYELGRAYIQTAMNLPIYETTAKYSGPVLIVNGMADQVVPYTYAQRYKDVLPQGELIIIPGENHSLSEDPSYIIKLVADWLIKNII